MRSTMVTHQQRLQTEFHLQRVLSIGYFQTAKKRKMNMLLKQSLRRSTDTNALLKDAQIKLRKEECARSMGQRWSTSDAKVKDAPIMLSKEEYALGMEQHGQKRNAVVKGAQIKSSEEECVSSMEQRSNDVATKDAQI